MALINYGVNCFITLADAETYFASKLYCEEWTAAVEATKEKSLIEATNRINRLQLAGLPVEKTQPLQFPRKYPPEYSFAQYMDNTILTRVLSQVYHYWILETEIPAVVKAAACEEALALLKYGNNTRIYLQAQGVTSASMSKISESYAGLKKLLSPEALELLKPYTNITGGVR